MHAIIILLVHVYYINYTEHAQQNSNLQLLFTLDNRARLLACFFAVFPIILIQELVEALTKAPVKQLKSK